MCSRWYLIGQPFPLPFQKGPKIKPLGDLWWRVEKIGGIWGKGISGLETELILTNHQSGVTCSVSMCNQMVTSEIGE